MSPRGGYWSTSARTKVDLAFTRLSLLGLAETNQTTSEGSPFSLPRAEPRMGIYVQDDWKVQAKWTINLGLRFDYVGNPVSDEGAWRTDQLLW